MFAELRGYPGRAFLVCFGAYLLSQMDLALFGYAIPEIRKEFGLSLSEIMGVVSAAFLVGGGLLVGLSVLPDRLGRQRMFQFSLITSSILVVLHSVVPNPATLALLRGASIATGGLSYPLTGAIVAEEFPARYRGFFLGLLQVGYPLGWTLASVLAGYILVHFGWRYVFLIGALSLPYLWLIKRVLREPPRSLAARANEKKASARDLLAPEYRRRTLLLFCAQFLFVWAYAGSVFMFPSFLVEVRGLDRSQYPMLIGIGHLIGSLGYILAAYVGEFVWSRRNTVVVWTLTGAVCFQCLIWFTDDFTSTLIAFGVMSMFFYGSAAVKFAYLAEVFPTRIRATAMTLAGSLAVILGSAAGPYCASLAVERFGWNLGYSVLVGVPLAMAGFLYLFLKKIPSGLEVEEVQTMYAKET